MKQELLDYVREFSTEHYKEYQLPPLFLVNIANLKGQEIADKLKADKQLVEIGTYLMDIGLAEALKKNVLKEHVEIGVTITKKILDKFDIPEEYKEKVVNCVQAHHKEVPFKSIEAEICVNADCYKFLHTKTLLEWFYSSGKDMDYEEFLEYAKHKVEEKKKDLSLGICIQELEPHIKVIDDLLKLV